MTSLQTVINFGESEFTESQFQILLCDTATDSHVAYLPRAFPREALADIKPECKPQAVNCFGKKFETNYGVAAYTRDGAAPYSYSNRTPVQATEFPAQLTAVVDSIGLRVRPNYAHVVQYASGRESALGDHPDDEPVIVAGTPIVSMTKTGKPGGAGRTFWFYERGNKANKREVQLGDGDLLIMYGKGMQQHYLHGVPRRVKQTDSRTCITLRTHHLAVQHNDTKKRKRVRSGSSANKKMKSKH